MKTFTVILITLAWFASWAGISLGLSGCLDDPAPEGAAVLASVEH